MHERYTQLSLINPAVTGRVGGAKVLLAGVILWSIGTLAAPPLAHISLFALCASRVFVSC